MMNKKPPLFSVIRQFLLPVLVVASCPVMAQVADSAQTGGEQVHVVQPGETLYRIATNNNMTVERLMAINGLSETTIRAGQRLRVTSGAPSTEGPAAPPADTGRVESQSPETEPPVDVERPVAETQSSGGTVYVVEPGDTLFSIALRYNTSVEALRRLNGISGDNIEVGQRLVVSGEGGAPAPTVSQQPVERRPWRIDDTTIPSDLVHFVQPGETLYSIAALYGFSLDELAGANQLTTAPLTQGEMIYLPAPRRPGSEDQPLLNLPIHEEGRAIVYPEVMEGRETTYGETYDPEKLTASHRTLPVGTVLLVTNPDTGRSTFVRVNDQGPVSRAYVAELSAAAAEALALDPDTASELIIRLLP